MQITERAGYIHIISGYVNIVLGINSLMYYRSRLIFHTSGNGSYIIEI